MKNIYYTLCLFFAATQISNAQCNPVIYPSPGCTKITSNTSINDVSGGCYWICTGLTVNVDASAGSAIYCEENVTLNINNSAGDQVYAKPGCVINNYSSADIGVCGNPSTFTMNNAGTGTTTLDCSCTTLTYDYSLISGGAGSCANTSAIDENTETKFEIYPNPVQQGEIFVFQTNSLPNKIIVTDVNGRLVFTAEKTLQINTGNMNAGIYFVQAELENGSIHALKLVVH